MLQQATYTVNSGLYWAKYLFYWYPMVSLNDEKMELMSKNLPLEQMEYCLHMTIPSVEEDSMKH